MFEWEKRHERAALTVRGITPMKNASQQQMNLEPRD